jgi:hypothetical protein
MFYFFFIFFKAPRCLYWRNFLDSRDRGGAFLVVYEGGSQTLLWKETSLRYNQALPGAVRRLCTFN